MGNDYAKYVEFMHLVNCDAYVPTEAGFNLLVKIIYGLSGFENYLLLCTHRKRKDSGSASLPYR